VVTVWYFGFMVLSATFNNISILLVEETEQTTDLSQVTDKLYHIMYRAHLTSPGFKLKMLGDRH
jgi:hypothetical protein